MKLFVCALICAPTFAAATCPALPERSAEHTQLMQDLSEASNETLAREISNQLWEIWATAPDETAQEILQRGMERRAGYDFAGAVEDFDTLIEYCPHYAEGYNQRAFVNFIRGDYVLALADLDRSLEITPDHVGSASGKALALLQLGRETEGQIALRHALSLNPWLPERGRLKPIEEIAPVDNDVDL